MGVRRIAAVAYTVLTAIVAVFQIALALGAPWGAYAMGGLYPGRLPPAVRVFAILQAMVLLLFAGVVLARGGLAFSNLARTAAGLIWVVVVVAAVAVVLNLITPSGGERIIWAPVSVLLLLCSLLVATGRKPDRTARVPDRSRRTR